MAISRVADFLPPTYVNRADTGVSVDTFPMLPRVPLTAASDDSGCYFASLQLGETEAQGHLGVYPRSDS